MDITQTLHDIVSRPYVFQYRNDGAWYDVAVFPTAAGALEVRDEATAGGFTGYLPAGRHYRVVDQRTGKIVG